MVTVFQSAAFFELKELIVKGSIAESMWIREGIITIFSGTDPKTIVLNLNI